ncbi:MULTISPECIES: ABC transporter permease [unclassified Chelatococcus]|uniref:ABC transporter permease n=1 Tax=unclassified Chelatococcus TaxID=2638111 RepID=UPI001BCE515C|nr:MULTISPECIES: ABC transporter permease [unclassified Chelatococcus]MBS7700680.1 ABC transporter permease [Chelatococcus sp. YT9]MBX3559111.1 ABC transporter permease [Chelatococcus sp.]
MIGFLLRRLLVAIPTVLLVSVSVFLLVRLIPGDPAIVMLGEGANEASLASFRSELGLDRPLPVQFFVWAERVLQGDLGQSILLGQPVSTLVFDRLKLSALIILLAVGIASVLAVAAGLFAAWRQNSLADVGIVALATTGVSLPSFWIGLLLLFVFGIKLGWLPVVGYVSFAEDPSQAWRYLVLPVLTLVIVEVGVLTRMARASAVEVLRLEYITHARAKGLPERAVLFKHALPNAFAPTLTMIGIVIGALLGGIAVVETVFTLPGLGRLLVEAIYGRDYPVIQGCLLVIALAYVLVNLVVDLLYPLFDPRISLE